MYKYDDIWFEIDFKIDLLHKQNKQKLGSFEMTFYHEDFESYFEKEFGEDLVAKEIWNKLNNDTFRSELNGASVKGKGPEDKFMEIYYTAANNIANNKYQF